MGSKEIDFSSAKDLKILKMKIIVCLLLLGLVNMQRPGEENEPKKPRRRMTPKGTGSRADWSFCSKDEPCGEREGDCDADDHCKAFHNDAHRLADCCVKKEAPTARCVIDSPLRL